MWHVSYRSGVATLRTAIHLLLTYLLTYLRYMGGSKLPGYAPGARLFAAAADIFTS